LGGFQHQPNVDSVEYFVDQIFPEIKKKLPDVKFYVIGSNPPLHLKDLCSKVKGVKFLGYVPEIDSYFNSCRIQVAPLRYGAGVKGKIVESMAKGLPVVTTPIGAEGISLENNKLFLIAESPYDFAEATVRLYSDEKLWTSISNNALEFAEQFYSPESVRETLRRILDKIIPPNLN